MDTPNEANDELKKRLSADQYYVTQEAGTEPAFSGCYWDTKEEGVYHCVVCDIELFSSEPSTTLEPDGQVSMNRPSLTRYEE